MKHEFSSLSVEQAGQCAHVCITNAHRLMGAGKLLFKNDYIELAIFAVCTAIEEGGKALILVEYQDDTADGKKDAARILKRAFYDHNRKLESAITAQEVDQQLADQIKKYASEHNESQNTVHKIVKMMENISVPDISPRVKSAFELRNSMIYAELTAYQEAAPWNRVQKSEFNRLLDIAEKIVARAELELSISDVCLKRGGSRRQFTKYVMAELPTIVDMMKKSLAEKKHLNETP